MPTMMIQKTKKQKAWLDHLHRHRHLEDPRHEQAEEAALIQRNQQRTAAILECHEQFRLLQQHQQWQRRRRPSPSDMTSTNDSSSNSSSDMQQQQQQLQLLQSREEILLRRAKLCREQRLTAAPAVLQHFGSRSLWYNLCPDDRWKRETLLQIYSYGGGGGCDEKNEAVIMRPTPPPPELSERVWIETFLTKKEEDDHDTHELSLWHAELWQQGDWILQDADILLARCQQVNFGKQHSTESLQFFVQPFLSNTAIMCQLITHIPWLVHCDGVLLEKHYQNADILLAYCRAPTIKACVALPKFDPALFQNADLMLQVLQTGVPVWSYLSRTLLDDKKFVLAAVKQDNMLSSSIASRKKNNQSNEHFRGSFAYLSKRLQRDVDIIHAYCQLDGTTLQWVDWNALCNNTVDKDRVCEIVFAACQQHPRAISYVTHSSSCSFARMALLQDARFVKRLLQQWREDSNATFLWQVWKDVPKDLLLNDTAVSGAALATYAAHVLNKAPTQRSSHHSRRFELLPSSSLQDPATWLHAFGYSNDYSSILWRMIPACLLQNCHTLVWPMLQSSHVQLCAWTLREMLQTFVQLLRDDPQFWLCAVHHSTDIVHELPHGILVNHLTVVLEACRLDPAGMLARLNSTEILQDQTVVATLLQHKPSLWRVLPDHVRFLYPDLMAVAMTNDFAATEKRNHALSSMTQPSEDNVPSLPPQLWVHPAVALAWCKYHRNLPPALRPQDVRTYASFLTNVNFMLQVVELNLHWFRDMSKPLCSNREFIRQAVAKDPRILCWASDPIRNDFDLQLAAFSRRADLPFRFSSLSYSSNCRDPEDGFELVAKFAFEVRRRLQTHQTLQQVFVQAMARTDPPSPLHLLNQGTETMQTYKKSFTEYLVGYEMSDNELEQLRQASSNLLMWGF